MKTRIKVIERGENYCTWFLPQVRRFGIWWYLHDHKLNLFFPHDAVVLTEYAAEVAIRTYLANQEKPKHFVYYIDVD